MRRIATAFALGCVMAASTVAMRAASLAGVTLPDTTQVGGTTLVLNGMGVRSKSMVKVYVGGLYLPRKSSDAESILKSDEAKQLTMKFLHAVAKSQLVDTFNGSFADNAPGAVSSMKSEIAQLMGALDSMKVGDQLAFTYVPGTGTSVAINGQNKVTIAGAAFAPVLFSAWLGPKPPNADMKKGLLGQ